MVLGKDLGQFSSVTLVSYSLVAVLSVLFKCSGAIVGQTPTGFSVSKSRGFTHGRLMLLLSVSLYLSFGRPVFLMPSHSSP